MRKSADLNVITKVSEFKFWVDSNCIPRQVRKPKSATTYVNIIGALDIETSATKAEGVIYSLQMNIGGTNFSFRYVEDLIECFTYISKKWHLRTDRRLIIYVQFLGYEAMWLLQILHEAFTLYDYLYTKRRKPLYLVFYNGIELRDSYKLFQKSLKHATEGLPHAKLDGDLDFRKWRTPDTPLSPTEFNYTINDVQGLWEGVRDIQLRHGFNAATTPLTNTALVIHEVNRMIANDYDCLQEMNKLHLNANQLYIAYKAMAGGDTHGSRWYAGKVVENCNSYDLKSAHPAQQLLDSFPAGPVTDFDEKADEEFIRDLETRSYGWIGLCYITDFRVRWNNPDPTISVSRCEEMEGSYGVDNGRLLGAQAIAVYMDSQDYIRFREGYEYESFVMAKGFYFRLKPLPEKFRQAIFEKFKDKESLSGGWQYAFSKIVVNTIFGACAQKTIRDTYDIEIKNEITCDTSKWEKVIFEKTEDEIIRSQKNKFPFLWGLWTASGTRLDLWNVIKAVGWENALYWDTDSCKYHGPKMESVDWWNASIKARVKELNYNFINRKGKEVFIGTAEDEHPNDEYGYKRFTFLHAKCYAVELADGTIESTIAGVGKAEGIAALKGDIANLKPGLFISQAGGSALSYIDAPIQICHKFNRDTQTASWIYSKDRSYLVQDGVRDIVEKYDFILA